MDFETTPKATLFFFFSSSSFCRALMRGRAGNLFSNVLFKADIDKSRHPNEMLSLSFSSTTTQKRW
jgi:hypothetical protein